MQLQDSEAKRQADEFILELKRKAAQAQELLDKNSVADPENGK